ncbi:MAG TPA: hypothetical protein VLC92_19320 [Rhodocyclaceae bacterium]|nr:hypothetical protein [Rhodocyclaceae bacterium]
MPSVARSIIEVVQDIKTAVALLESAERWWPSVMQIANQTSQGPEASQLEDLLHRATHETSNSLAFLVQDIEALLALSRVRQKFAVFTPNQFDRIVEKGWSTGLVQELHQELPSISLSELSAQIKHLLAEWSGLPNDNSKRRS